MYGDGGAYVSAMVHDTDVAHEADVDAYVDIKEKLETAG